MSETRDNTGILFKNDKKQSDRHPDYTGRATVNGVECFMDAWIKDGAKGKFMSFAFKPKDKQPGSAAKPVNTPASRSDIDDEIPF